MARDLNDPTQVTQGGVITVPERTKVIAPGTLVGGYRVERMLGTGGMGQVYEAIHPMIHKRVAIKVLLPALSKNVEIVERFITEARAVNQIGHPNIVDIFAFGQLDDGRDFMVMDLLIGENLRSRLRRGIPPVRETIAISDQIGSALIAAHAAGIVHRDLKPDNVFLVESEVTEVKLLDFGIAKLLAVHGPRLVETASGAVIGTPAYMAPEQARGAAVDARADIYALGIMLFELLTGSLPFDATHHVDVLRAHLEEVPPAPSTRVAGLPRELDAIVLGMLRKPADARPDLPAIRAALKRLAKQLAPPPSGVYVTPATLDPDADTFEQDAGSSHRGPPSIRAAAVEPAPTSAGAVTGDPSASQLQRRRGMSLLTAAVAVAAVVVVAVVTWRLLARHRSARSTPAVSAPLDAPAAADTPAIGAAAVDAAVAVDASPVAVDPVVRTRDAAPARPHVRAHPDARPPTAGSARPPEHRGSADCDPMRSLGGC